MSPRFLSLATLAALALACSTASDGGGGTGPDPTDTTVSQDSLTFLRPAVTAPPLAERTQSFWAVRGERRELRLMYQKAAGATDSFEFIRFRVDDRTLVSDSAGNPLASGDSVLITVTVSDTANLIIQFAPSGLVFNPSRPARLWIKFRDADPDLDEDGFVTAADTTILLGLQIWKEEQLGDPWSPLVSSVDTVEQEVEADVPGFTRYAVAY